MRHPEVEKWEQKLHRLLSEIDDEIEDRYGKLYRLHPVRAPRGTTADKSQDGLFRLTASFSLGIGSRHGSGYVVDMHFSTLEHVSAARRREIEHLVVQQIETKLPQYFPERQLRVSRDGALLKIHGDLSLN
jgi:hypothetical protein